LCCSTNINFMIMQSRGSMLIIPEPPTGYDPETASSSLNPHKLYPKEFVSFYIHTSQYLYLTKSSNLPLKQFVIKEHLTRIIQRLFRPSNKAAVLIDPSGPKVSFQIFILAACLI